MRPSGIAIALTVVAAALVPGLACVPRTPNPRFPAPEDEAALSLGELARNPVAHARPILVLGGYMDPGFAAGSLERSLRRVVGAGTPIVTVSFGDCTSMSQCRNRVLAATESTRHADQECSFDVVANSMGGLVARYCAMSPDAVTGCGLPAPDRTATLRIHHLYTICTPHRGARMAEGALGSPMTRDMRPDSPFLGCLDNAIAGSDYGLTCFAREGDIIVGADRCAPPGKEPIRFDTPPLELAHVDAHRDPRILLAIVRSLRRDASLPLGE